MFVLVSCVLTLRDPMNCRTQGFPVLHHLLEFVQIHVHWVSDAIQWSHPVLPSSPLALNLSQHQGLFPWVSSSHQAAKVLELQLLHQSFQWIGRLISCRTDRFDLFAVQGILKHLLQHHNSKASILWYSAIHDYCKNHSFDYMDLCWQSDVSTF